MVDGGPLVSVIVPCFNAAATIRETLLSIMGQTYARMEIIVVDDGSSDGSARIVEQLASTDRRIRLISQQNQGVAAARNAGILASNGAHIAPIDADDLWAPDKLARQMEVFELCGDRVGVVYTWYAQIDAQSRVISLHHRPDDEGQVLGRICRNNFVGNGSSAVMRKRLVEQVGGYDPGLRAQGGQGCEDWKLLLQLSAICEFRVIPAHLTGYRSTGSNMSSDTLQMMRSTELVAADSAKEFPQHERALKAHVGDTMFGLFERALLAGQHRASAILLGKMFGHDPSRALFHLAELPERLVRQGAPRSVKRLAKSVSTLGKATYDQPLFNAPDPAAANPPESGTYVSC